jgi:hypothetical protein
MKRMKKFLGMLLLLAIVAALVGVGLRAFNPWEDKHRESNAQQHVQQDGNGEWHQPGSNRDDAQPRRDGHDAMNYGHEQTNRGHEEMNGRHGEHRGDFGGGKWLMLIGDLLLVVAGWTIWKRGGRGVRWIGGLLIALALLPLLAMALSIAVPVLVIYLIWRCFRRSARPAMPEFVAEQTYTASTVDLLDQWEAKTRQQMNNNKEEN